MVECFQKYLISKGFKRTCIKGNSKNEVEEYESNYLSSYNPLQYNFRKESKYCYFGLSERGRPPVINLGSNKMSIVHNKENFRTYEDGYRILFSKWHENKFNDIYDVFMSENKYFVVNCEDENNIHIKIKTNNGTIN